MRPEDTQGYVVDMFVDGASLFGILEMTGEEAILMALRNDVSVYSPPEWKAGTGTTFERPILHVALTPYPVVPGLEGSTSIAASLVEEPVMNWKSIKEAFGIGEELTDETAEKLLLSSAASKAKKAKELETEIGKLQEELKKLKLSVEAGDKPPAKTKADPVVASLVAENRSMRIANLANLDPPAITPAVATALSELYAQGPAIEMSITQEDNDAFDKLIKVLEQNSELIQVRSEMSGPQLLSLSMPAGDKSAEMLKKDAEARAEGKNEVW
jgi:hypothetical protein